MKKGVWNVENPLALSELFSDGIFLLPVSEEVGVKPAETAETVNPAETTEAAETTATAKPAEIKSPESKQATPNTVKFPKWEGVFIVNLIYEESQIDPVELVKKVMQFVRIPEVQLNGQTVKFIQLAQGASSLTPEMLEQYLQHFTQLRIVFWVNNSEWESNFKQVNHPRILLVDMPSVMWSSEQNKQKGWTKIKSFFGM